MGGSRLEGGVKKKLTQESSADKVTIVSNPLPDEAPAGNWPQFRGPGRDGRVPWLPATLPDELSPAWETLLPSTGIGGVAVDSERVIVGSRDPSDRLDLFQAFDRKSGLLMWQAMTPAIGQLDYGNSPRATPLIYDSLVITLGAFGDLSCLDLETGIPLWKINFQQQFDAPLPIWGFCGSPIVIDEQLIVQPGAPDASLVALDLVTGEVLWQVEGPEAVYASLVQSGQQIVGLDSLGIAGWSHANGKRLWRISPPVTGDFGVPSAVPTPSGLLMTSENNGTRLYEYDGQQARSSILGQVKKIAPNSHTPVVIDQSAFVVHNKLYCLALDNKLSERWVINDRAFRGFTSLMASKEQLLALTSGCELILVDAVEGKIVDRLRLADRNMRTLAQPALAGKELFVRVGNKLLAIDLNEQ